MRPELLRAAKPELGVTLVEVKGAACGIEKCKLAGEIFADPDMARGRGSNTGGGSAECRHRIRAHGVGCRVQAANEVSATGAQPVVIQFGKPDVAGWIDAELFDVRVGFF